MQNPALAKRGLPVFVQEKQSPESSLDTRRAQYLAEIFQLPASTATTVAELAFGECGR